MITRRSFLGAGVAGALLAQPAKRPNILCISCENLGPHLGCYGDASVSTPAIDEFAAAAVRFDRAYAVSGVGPVSRSAVQTGMFPSTIGTHMNGRATLPAFVKPFTEHLKQAGYFIAATGPKAKVPPPGVPVFTWKRLDAVSFANVRLRGDAYARTIRAVKAGQRRGPGEPAFPPQFEDTEETRQDWSNYHELIALLDRQFAARLQTVPPETVVIFFSEFGFTLREGNSAAYESGTRVPLLVRAPRLQAAVSQRRVMLLDLAPSILNLAGIPIPVHMQGQAFLGDRLPPQRRSVFATVDRADMRYETIRSMRSGGLRYVRNYTKGTEELFDSDKDPNEVKNLASSDAAAVTRMREQLERWRIDTRDLGLIPEAELAVREALLRSRYAIGKQTGFDGLQQRLTDAALAVEDGKIRAAMFDEDAAVRAVACGKAYGGRLGSELRKALGDASAAVRIQAARRLRMASNEDALALKTLVRELRSQEEWVRFAAVLAIEELGEKDAAVVAAIRAMAKADPNKTVAALAARVVKGIDPQP